HMKQIALAAVLALTVPLSTHAAAQTIPTPSDFLKMPVGADGVLATYEQITSYWKAVASMSDRITVEDLGPTTEGHHYLVAIITSPANQKRLDDYRELNARLYDPRRTSEEEAKRLIAEGKTIVAMQLSIHSTEVGAAQLSMELAYRFATENTPRMLSVLDNTIIILSPSHNPDGTQMVADWNNQYRGTPYQDGPLPFLYQKYVGHDDNRDWYMFTQKESQITVAKIWNRWHPQISYDLHQMSPFGARLFVPPWVDPYDPNIDPTLRAETTAIGSTVAMQLTAAGKAGVVIHGVYDAWTPARQYVDYHGGIRILTELASAKLAEPMTLRFDQLRPGLGYDARQVAWNFPMPWRGGTWRLRDIMDYEDVAVDAVLDYAAKYRQQFLTNFYDVNKRSIGRTDPETGQEKPYAIVVPAAQDDVLGTYRLLWVLQFGDVEIQRATAPFTAGGRQYAAGTHVILMAQPASAYAKTLMEVQHYPDLRLYPGGPPQPPYDVAAYTLPLLLGVKSVFVQQPFQAQLVPVANPIMPPAGAVVGGTAKSAYVFAHDNAGVKAMNHLEKAGLHVEWASAPFTEGGHAFPAGTIVLPVAGQPGAEAAVRAEAAALPVAFHAVNGSVPAGLTVTYPRVGLYKSFVPSMDEGWTRWIFEQWGMDYTSIENKDVRAGNLRARFDAIILPQEAPRAIIDGHEAGTVPDEYAGGIGEEGVAALKAFVEAGGTLIAFDTACLLPVEQFGLPVKNALAGLSGSGRGGDRSSAAFYGPGSIVRTKVDVSSPIASGASAEGVAWFEQSPAFQVSGNAKAVVTYPTDGTLLLSGWLLGPDHLKGLAGVVDAPLGKGHVVLFGFRPQYRAQTWATYTLLFNALYDATAPAGSSASAAGRH
ncbi:MAG TPA: M14 metallopeptidase family protein, partial [Vicinamibacterales bacterium]|nr:M14 metallopeptidase family protein [Vicinamibacterales bacterium]